ncbi:MOSC domain-containing protein [Reichenbachiella agarivorans]|uniref:MOSC domain-containing protein n=1 Tax=Reichenbachiella agarivorans TaxID=2979464 RepID=A0ABY6CLZ4_9BACT|nr:MOSC domain-containing protein [Reichenbachiella agarivorans]UXP30749.1 MOSC domain-containing protein [Reichenbachiella agarivorans]
MKVVSTNIAQPREIIWNGKPEITGIFKESTSLPIQLGTTDVVGDAVIDRRYHGGVDKACYLYAADHYDYWRAQYPDKELPYGMFGENLTVEGLDETKMIIGDVYQLGTAKVQVSEPRQPCYKLGIRFDDQGILKKFVNSTFSGVYVRVLEVGEVSVGDTFELIESVEQGLSIAEIYGLIYAKTAEPETMRTLLSDQYLPTYLKLKLLDKLS